MARITGAHAIIYSRDAEADRGFLRDVLGFPFVDVGHGWLIFGLPPAEGAVHPAENAESHELCLMVDDVKGFVAALSARGLSCTPIRDLRWGLLTQVPLPSGARLGVYESRQGPRPAEGGEACGDRATRPSPANLTAKAHDVFSNQRRSVCPAS